jgi:hypothetical protein
LADHGIIKVNPDQYRKLVTPDILDFEGSIFYEPEFLITAAEMLRLKFDAYLCIKNEKVLGLANYLVGGKAGIKIAAIPSLFQYFGPVVLDNDPVLFGELIEPLSASVDSAIFSLTPPNISDFNITGWSMRKRLTYYLKPDSFEKMKKRCIKSAKWRANKAANSNVVFEASRNFPYDLYQASFNRQRVRPPVGCDTLTLWAGRLADLGLLENYLAIINSKPVAMLTVLIYGKYAYTWLSGALPDYLKLGINHYLVLKAGEALHHKGIENIDMVGGDIESIGEFKKSVGGEPVHHWQIEKDFTMKGKIYRALMKTRARTHV